MDKLRVPFFCVALVAMTLAILVELGSMALLGSKTPASLDVPKPGYGIPYHALQDGLVLFTVGLMGVSLLLPERVHGRVQGIATLIFSLVILIVSILLIILAFVMLMLMVGLLLAVPFGTVVYTVLYGLFNRDGARITLSLIMTLKIVFAVCLVLAHQRFLQNKGLVFIILTSLLATLIVGFLHGLVPGFLVSITDALAGIILGILGAIWALVFLIGSLVSIVKVLRVDRAA